MRQVGVDPDRCCCTAAAGAALPADGRGLRCRPARRAGLRARGAGDAAGRWRERLALLAAAALGGGRFRCARPHRGTQLCRGLPAPVRDLLIDPLCVAALNTPAPKPAPQVFLRVLRDALFGGRGAADLLLPRRPLGDLLPGPAAALAAAARRRGAAAGQRVMRCSSGPRGWQVDGQPFDAVVLACSASRSRPAGRAVARGLVGTRRGLRFEPIVTVYLQCAGRPPARR
jgi:hypothetical protein